MICHRAGHDPLLTFHFVHDAIDQWPCKPETKDEPAVDLTECSSGAAASLAGMALEYADFTDCLTDLGTLGLSRPGRL